MRPTSKDKIVTVIVAAYKAQRFVVEALESILKQTLPEGWKLQLILGIDACPVTKKAIQKVKHTSLEIYMMKKNRGTYVTFNTMMQYAKGDIISRFDADDIMYQEFLYDAIIKIEEGYSLVRYKLDIIDQNNKKTGSYPCGFGMVTFSRRTWNTVGGYQPWRCAADSEMITKVKFTPSLKSYHLTRKAYVGYRNFSGSGSLTIANSTAFGSPERNERSAHVNRNEEAWKNGKNLDIKTVPLIGKCVKLL